MSDKYYHGLQWENLALGLIDLFSTLGGVTGSLPGVWRPMLPGAGTTLEASDAWRKIEADYCERVHAATRALIKTEPLPDLTPEIVYFLKLRIRAALDHVEAMFVIKDEKPMSLFTFPALPPEEVMAWLLTDWADDHAIMTVFPATDAACSQSTPDSSLLAPSF